MVNNFFFLLLSLAMMTWGMGMIVVMSIDYYIAAADAVTFRILMTMGCLFLYAGYRLFKSVI